MKWWAAPAIVVLLSPAPAQAAELLSFTQVDVEPESLRSALTQAVRRRLEQMGEELQTQGGEPSKKTRRLEVSVLTGAGPSYDITVKYWDQKEHLRKAECLGCDQSQLQAMVAKNVGLAIDQAEFPHKPEVLCPEVSPVRPSDLTMSYPPKVVVPLLFYAASGITLGVGTTLASLRQGNTTGNAMLTNISDFNDAGRALIGVSVALGVAGGAVHCLWSHRCAAQRRPVLRLSSAQRRP